MSSAVDLLADTLRSEILEGSRPGEERLREQELARTHGAARAFSSGAARKAPIVTSAAADSGAADATCHPWSPRSATSSSAT